MTHPVCKTRYTVDGLISFFHYTGVIKKAVKAIKYRLVSDLARELIELIPPQSLSSAMKHCDSEAMLVPIPLHPSRYRERGFNQAEILGNLIAAKLRIHTRTDMLKRMQKTTPQVGMKDRKKRLENMRGVFTTPSNLQVFQSLNLFVFDDVFTTGATMRSAVSALKRAGFRHVWAVSLAR
ncbi:hypothetical protein M1555_04090 [Patescibacteria group bacterium]|nr:hypothetical protein [Patescibacteria group bacterium]